MGMDLKNIKKYLGMAVLVSLAAMTISCDGKSEAAVKNETTETVQIQAAAAAIDVQSATQPVIQETTIATVVKAETLSEADSILLHVISGTVTDAGTGTVTIKTDRYPEGVTFSITDVATGLSEGLLVDQEITVFYRGDIRGGDASGVAAELLRDKREGDVEAQAAEVTGKVSEIGMSVISIETTDGRYLSFEQNPKPVNMTTGPLEGDTVTILYSYQDEGQEGAVAPELISN